MEKFHYKVLFLVILEISFCKINFAQQRYNVILFNEEKEFINNAYFKPNVVYDSLAVLSASSAFITDQRIKGYIFANLDSISFKKDKAKLYFHTGSRYQYKIKSQQSDIAKLINSNYGYFKNFNLLDSQNIDEKLKFIIKEYNNSGYPFAVISFDSVVINQNDVAAHLIVNKGKYIVFDSIYIHGIPNINKSFLYKYLGFKKQSSYNHDLVLNMSKRINELPFLQLDSLPTISFVNETATLRMGLSNKTASRFDAIVGILPEVKDGIRKWNLNYDFNAELYNRFSRGENIQLKFRRLSFQDQQVFTSIDYPYIFNSNFGVNGLFELNFNNSISTDVNALVGSSYLFTGNDIFKTSWNYKSSSLINVDSLVVKNSNRLPVQLDSRYNGLSFNFFKRKVNYRFNPTKGFETTAIFNFGNRSIRKNNQILKITGFENAYDTLQLQSFQAELILNANFYFPIRQWSAIKTSFNTAYKYTNGFEIQNENFRIGGNRLLRGFNELSIYTNAYLLWSTEFKILLDKNSFLSFPFIDLARVKVFSESVQKWQNAIGLGFGLNFSTRAGIFNLSIAAGNQFKGSPDFSNTKVHFGYLNLF